MKKRLRKKLGKKEYDLRSAVPFLRAASEKGLGLARAFEQARKSIAPLLRE
jgi:hypothetical protein